MIKRLHKHLFSALAVLSFMFIHTSCVEHLDESVYEPTDYVAFKASLSGETKSVPTKGFTGNLNFEEEDWDVELYSGSGTKATLYNSLNGLDAGVYGYVYSGDLTIDTSPVTDINGHKYIFDGDQLDAEEPIRWNKVDAEATDGDKFRAFVYAPKDAVSPSYQNGTSATGAPVIKIADIVSCQKDIVVADKEIVIDKTSKSHRKQIPLDFEHIFTAVQFKAGFDCTITSISISGLKTAGDYVIGTGWDNTTSTDFNLPLDKQLSKGDIIDPILMIPQKFGEGAQINLIINGDTSKPLTADLNGVEWRQGKKITYTLMTGAREYIYLDLAAGNVNITGNSYTGYVFDNKDLKEVKGTIQSGQKYYIYQSCTQNESCPNYMIGFSGDTFTKPKYDPVKGPDGRLWSDYITNNTSVENVIEAWDNKTGATDNTEIDNTKAVRKVGRESTKNHISVSGNIGDCFMVIDNIYSSYQQPSVSRTTGGIAYTPGKDSNLTINLIGDNRVGCVHYTNTSTDNHNQLIFDGEGSLTVADADFNTTSHNGTEYPGVENMGERTYFSNHWCSAIGGNDSGSSQEVYGIVINGGTIFAGTTKAENCTAIGGGGNGHGQVTINGGSVTAVATTTGTAIGGGIGYNSAGGSGDVKITGGNVYAYNYANRWKIPSSAIGGAGSRKASGSTGNVTIEAGSIYAYSALGTAIGGGSSAWNTAGKGIVNINGGTIIAKNGDKNSAGIGGGSAYTEKYEAGNTKNGGDAEITITGNPVIRTGSIGGGSPGSGASYGGTIGSAKITVTGGDIQAQFVMADSDNNVFNMEGGESSETVVHLITNIIVFSRMAVLCIWRKEPLL